METQILCTFRLFLAKKYKQFNVKKNELNKYDFRKICNLFWLDYMCLPFKIPKECNLEIIFKQHIICSICGKIFKNKENLNNHINQLKRTDYFHHILNTKNKDLEKNILEQTQKEKINGYKPVFGKLNFRNKNK